jgi:transcriptional regulator with XRE-family HTH domain
MRKQIYLRTARRQAHLTQTQLAKKARITQKQVSELETNPDLRPLFQTVVAIAQALNLEPMQLRFGPVPARRKASEAVA